MEQYRSMYPAQSVAQVGAEERSAFLRRVYQHVAGALALFMILEAILQAMPFSTTVAERMSLVAIQFVYSIQAITTL